MSRLFNRYAHQDTDISLEEEREINEWLKFQIQTAKAFKEFNEAVRPFVVPVYEAPKKKYEPLPFRCTCPIENHNDIGLPGQRCHTCGGYF